VSDGRRVARADGEESELWKNDYNDCFDSNADGRLNFPVSGGPFVVSVPIPSDIAPGTYFLTAGTPWLIGVGFF
jgi:hypothetical protein